MATNRTRTIRRRSYVLIAILVAIGGKLDALTRGENEKGRRSNTKKGKCQTKDSLDRHYVSTRFDYTRPSWYTTLPKCFRSARHTQRN